SRWRRHSMKRLFVFLVLLGAAVLAAGGASGSRSSSTLLATFSTPGTYSWTVPAGVTKGTFDVFGASGGHGTQFPPLVPAGGPGGEAKGQFTVKPGQVFEVVVGGRGVDANGKLGGAGGFNGGGAGANLSFIGVAGAGGGGASDVRIGGSGNSCASALG